MKKILLFNFLLFLSAPIIAQNNVIPGGDFEAGPSTQCQINQLPNVFNASNYYWNVAEHNNDQGERHPDLIVYNDCGYGNYCLGGPASNTFAVIKSDVSKCKKKLIGSGYNIQKWHEAIAIAHYNGAFAQNQNYTIRYKIIPIQADNDDSGGDPYHQTCLDLINNCHLRIFLSELGYQGWNQNNSTKQEIYNANFQSLYDPFCNWIVVERNFVCNYSNLKNLILYAESGGFIIDDVEIFPKCDNSYLIQNKNYSFPEYAPNSQGGNHFSEQSSDYILAGYNVGANVPLGNVNIQNGAAVVYTASNKITLKPGFKAEKSSYFHAVIANCPNNIRNDDINDRPTKVEGMAELGKVNKNNISNYPNPFTTTTTIEFNIPEAANVSLSVYNATGSLIQNLINDEYKDPGIHSISFGGSNLNPGIYIYKLQVGSETMAGRMVLMRQ